MRPHSLQLILASSFALASEGCGPTTREEADEENARAYARAACHAIAECECVSRYGDRAACETELTSRFIAILDLGFAADLDCIQRTQDEIGNCDSAPENGSSRCVGFRGTKTIGEPCVDHSLEVPPFDTEECAEGSCVSGVCAETGGSLALGSACDPSSPSCGAPDVYCAPDGFCRAAASIGQPCDSPWGCKLIDSATSSLLYCEGFDHGTCVPRRSIGESCSTDDWLPCTQAAGILAKPGWCDAAANTCVAEGPAICNAVDYPRARP